MTQRYSLAVLAVVFTTGLATPSLLGARPTDVMGSSQQIPQDPAAARRLIEQRLGKGASQAEVMERLRQSGLSRSQVRIRLQQMGYDPGLADQYFDVIERGGEPPRGEASNNFLGALQEIGVVVSGSPADASGPGQAENVAVDTLVADSLVEDSTAPDRVEVFGRALFRRSTVQFQPILTGPVDADYRLGPGDEIILILTGDVELAYALQVTRQGYLIIPDVGQISVNGLTLGGLENHLYDRLGRVYSGVRRGTGATTRFQVSLGRLRVNQVYAIGDVERPNAYQVSAAATVFHALYQAGGPSENGSFRKIEVRRGKEVIATVDLYDYLLRGDNRGDLRLEQGDIIFVPPAGRQVRVEGAARRRAIYELTDGDDLREVLSFAGGLEAEAFVRRVQIDRILPPSKRRPGLERVLMDVDVQQLLSDSGEGIELQDGDVVQVFAVSNERRHRVMVNGEVRRPGVYEWADGLTLRGLIDRAQGLAERAYTPRAHIYRLNEQDGNRRLIQTPLLADSAGQPAQDVMLADRDSVVIFSREELRNPEFVTINGFVKHPGTFALAEGMAIPDLILAAGGFIAGAYTVEAEVARLPVGLERTNATARVFRVPLGGSRTESKAGGDQGEPVFRDRSKAPAGALNDPPVWMPDPDEFTLQHGDRVFIRKSPGYELPRPVTITGEVMFPGTYVLGGRQERLVDLIRRAGGLTSEAYAPGVQLIRDSSLVATDLPRALRQPDGRFNLVLRAEDSLHVPNYDPTVRVTGAVTFESRILYEPGKGLDYYINRAGGYTDLADKNRVTVTYQDGERAAVDRVLLVFHNRPGVQPGSTILVPTKPESELRGLIWGEVISRTASLATTLVTLLIAVNQLK